MSRPTLAGKFRKRDSLNVTVSSQFLHTPKMIKPILFQAYHIDGKSFSRAFYPGAAALHRRVPCVNQTFRNTFRVIKKNWNAMGRNKRKPSDNCPIYHLL